MKSIDGKVAFSALKGFSVGYALVLVICIIVLLFVPSDEGFDYSTMDESLSAYEEVLDKYLYKKYGIVIGMDSECEYHDNSKRYKVTFVNNNYPYPDRMVTCFVSLDENSGNYEFTDNFYGYLYLSEVQKNMEMIAKKHFKGEYYVVVETRGFDSDSEIMSYEECVGRYGQYCVYIYEYGMNKEEAYAAMQEFVAEVESLGFQYSFYLGRNRDDDKEGYLEYIEERSLECIKGDIDAEWNRYVEWIYYKWLPPIEKNMEPKIYILTGDE